MENLSKQQLVLLALLVSFVTSIATGIVTVSLLDQAPKAVTQTINQVIEKTIERVVPSENTATVIREVKEIKVIVKEEEAIVKAIENISKSLVRISSIGPDTGSRYFVSLGLVISDDGLVITDKSGISDAGAYDGDFSDGTKFELKLVARNENQKIAYLKAVGSNIEKYQFTKAVLNSKDNLRLGQSVFSIGGINSNSLVRGTLISLPKLQKEISFIETDMRITDEFTGASLVNSIGEVIGMRTRISEISAKNAFIPIGNINTQLSEIASSTSPSSGLEKKNDDLAKTVD